MLPSRIKLSLSLKKRALAVKGRTTIYPGLMGKDSRGVHITSRKIRVESFPPGISREVREQSSCLTPGSLHPWGWSLLCSKRIQGRMGPLGSHFTKSPRPLSPPTALSNHQRMRKCPQCRSRFPLQPPSCLANPHKLPNAGVRQGLVNVCAAFPR